MLLVFFGNSLGSPAFGKLFQAGVYVFEAVLRGEFGEHDKDIGQFKIEDHAQSGRAKHDYHVKDIAENGKGIGNTKLGEDIKEADKNSSEVKAADHCEFAGVLGIGQDDGNSGEQSDKNHNYCRKRRKNQYKQPEEKQQLLEPRQL